MGRRRSPVEPVRIQQELHCSVEDQRRLLGASPFFSRLDPNLVEEVQRSFRQQHYLEGDVIQAAGDPAARLSIVAAGTVKMARPTVDGQDVLLDFLGPGEHFGSLAELGDDTYREDVIAHTACCILYTTTEVFHGLLNQYPVVALSSLQMVAARLRDAHTIIEQLSAHPVDQRVAATLLHLAEKRGRQDEEGTLIEIPLSRQDIADMTGAKVETVSRVLSEFRRSGLIDSGRLWIAVTDPDALARIADATLA
jgi:CRP/FNR family transcriptional regulator, nitrogen oxide reductase regulator